MACEGVEEAEAAEAVREAKGEPPKGVAMEEVME